MGRLSLSWNLLLKRVIDETNLLSSLSCPISNFIFHKSFSFGFYWNTYIEIQFSQALPKPECLHYFISFYGLCFFPILISLVSPYSSLSNFHQVWDSLIMAVTLMIKLTSGSEQDLQREVENIFWIKKSKQNKFLVFPFRFLNSLVVLLFRNIGMLLITVNAVFTLCTEKHKLLLLN